MCMNEKNSIFHLHELLLIQKIFQLKYAQHMIKYFINMQFKLQPNKQPSLDDYTWHRIFDSFGCVCYVYEQMFPHPWSPWQSMVVGWLRVIKAGYQCQSHQQTRLLWSVNIWCYGIFGMLFPFMVSFLGFIKDIIVWQVVTTLWLQKTGVLTVVCTKGDGNYIISILYAVQ